VRPTRLRLWCRRPGRGCRCGRPRANGSGRSLSARLRLLGGVPPGAVQGGVEQVVRGGHEPMYRTGFRSLRRSSLWSRVGVVLVERSRPTRPRRGMGRRPHIADHYTGHRDEELTVACVDAETNAIVTWCSRWLKPSARETGGLRRVGSAGNAAVWQLADTNIPLQAKGHGQGGSGPGRPRRSTAKGEEHRSRTLQRAAQAAWQWSAARLAGAVDRTQRTLRSPEEGIEDWPRWAPMVSTGSFF
jgi:hypothetical protein